MGSPGGNRQIGLSLVADLAQEQRFYFRPLLLTCKWIHG